jgi:hypothetical protein
MIFCFTSCETFLEPFDTSPPINPRKFLFLARFDSLAWLCVSIAQSAVWNFKTLREVGCRFEDKFSAEAIRLRVSRQVTCSVLFCLRFESLLRGESKIALAFVRLRSINETAGVKLKNLLVAVVSYSSSTR